MIMIILIITSLKETICSKCNKYHLIIDDEEQSIVLI